MQDLPDRASAPSDAVKTRDEEHHGVSPNQSERRTEVGPVRTQRGMPEEIPEDVRRHGREPTDVRVRSIFYTILGLLAGIVVSGAFVGGVLLAIKNREETAPVSAVSRTDLLPPEPRLQIAPQAERRAFEEAAHARLNEYGWAGERGRAHIPIARAMKLLADHGWPDPDEQDASSRDATGAGLSPGSSSEPRMRQQIESRDQSNPNTPSLKAPP